MTTPMKESVSAWPNSSPAFRPDASPDVDRRIRVAFVEDDDDYREAVSGELADYGFDVTTFCEGTALLASFADGAEAEIIVLDWSLPSVSGIDLLPRLRRNGVALPVVFLTGRSQPAYEQLAFDRGERRKWLPNECPLLHQADQKQVPSRRPHLCRDR